MSYPWHSLVCVWGSLTCRGAVWVFYNPIRLGKCDVWNIPLVVNKLTIFYFHNAIQKYHVPPRKLISINLCKLVRYLCHIFDTEFDFVLPFYNTLKKTPFKWPKIIHLTVHSVHRTSSTLFVYPAKSCDPTQKEVSKIWH